MSTPARTPHRQPLYHIDTSVTSRAFDDYAAYSSGLETPLSAHLDRRPSLSFSALSEPSPASLPTTPGYTRQTVSHEATPLYFSHSNNALRMMNAAKGMPHVVRHVQDSGMSSFDLLSNDHADFHVPATLSPMCDSFNTSFTSTASTESWPSLAETPMPQLGQPINLRTPNLNVGAFTKQEHMTFPKQEHMGDMYCDTLSQMPPAPSHSFSGMTAQQYFSPQQLELGEHDMMYNHPMDSGMTTPIDPHHLHAGSFDSAYNSWSPEGLSPQFSSLHEDGMIRPKDEPGLHMMPVHPLYGQHTPINKRTRFRQRGSVQKRGRTGSVRYVASHYDVDLAIDTKGIEYDEKAGRYIQKKLNVETKRWKCSVPGCESRSARKEHLRRHELSHQPEKQFHCNLPKCNRAITRSDNLIQHLMTHARPAKPGKRNNHHSREKIEQMVLDTMTDPKLAERTITNLGKAIEREQDKWQPNDSGIDWTAHDADEDTADYA